MNKGAKLALPMLIVVEFALVLIVLYGVPCGDGTKICTLSSEVMVITLPVSSKSATVKNKKITFCGNWQRKKSGQETISWADLILRRPQNRRVHSGLFLPFCRSFSRQLYKLEIWFTFCLKIDLFLIEKLIFAWNLTYFGRKLAYFGRNLTYLGRNNYFCVKFD